ncbi:MAG: redoxin domain-containing protein [Alphaproteobacteria bacterium]|nr:redoxin domain-containing protein [Alphaproteobacteria bacterium]MBU0797303.1 redoxin domain-containing protein [Alphaproteobacteria bacterium]MBU0888909.1 redoxin domain-containing protein [Alphaproteobacteria bacterium]MBU1813929.1 redoxin domain-containing protein [Alphaproteobacteria bacterium]
MLMRKMLTGTALGITLALSAGSALAVGAAAEIGQPAPVFTGKGADGSTVSLEALRGKTVVLEWTNHDCPFVRKHYSADNMQGVQKEAAAKDIVWLQVISSGPGKQGHVDGPTAIKLNQDRGAAVANTVLDVDGSIGKAYGAQTTPHMYIVDPKGVLVYKGGIDSIPSARSSDIPQAVNYVREALDAMEKGAAIPNANTRAYGCTVHYAS